MEGAEASERAMSMGIGAIAREEGVARNAISESEAGSVEGVLAQRVGEIQALRLDTCRGFQENARLARVPASITPIGMKKHFEDS